jgi:[ribosomal protein S18]-alanine N-acetyltransferase
VSANPHNAIPVVRAMLASDLDGVAAIEASTYLFPWSRGIFSDCLMAGYPCFVLAADECIVGYAILSVAAAEAHILNLCVAEQFQHQGLGRQLLDHLLQLARSLSVERIFLEVRPSNTAAIQLYESAGFSRMGLRKEYYRAINGREDALVLALEFPAR